MRLYHGSNISIEVVDLTKCRPNKDFGCGFYTTSILNQANDMAERVARRYGGLPCVTAFEIDDSVFEEDSISIKRFNGISPEWAMFIMNNRTGDCIRNQEYMDNNLDNRYDIVIGPVANDDLSMIFRLFERRIINMEMLIHEMQFRKLTDQFSFHTKRSISLLKRLGSIK